MIRALIDANKKALEERTLGAFAHNYCAYTYDNSIHRCAVGVVLTIEQIDTIHAEYLNTSHVAEIGLQLSSEELAVYQWTQHLHDCWATGTEVEDPLKDNLPLPLAQFVSRYENQSGGEQRFRNWIALLDREYPV